MDDLVTSVVTFQLEALQAAGWVGEQLTKLSIEDFGQERVVADVQVSDHLQVHIANDAYRLLVPEANVLEDELINVAGTSDAVRDGIGVLICHLNLVRVHLVGQVVAVDHAEALWYLSFLVHLTVILDQMTVQIIQALNFIDLNDLFSILVLLNGIVKSAFTD